MFVHVLKELVQLADLAGDLLVLGHPVFNVGLFFGKLVVCLSSKLVLSDVLHSVGPVTGVELTPFLLGSAAQATELPQIVVNPFVAITVQCLTGGVSVEH